MKWWIIGAYFLGFVIISLIYLFFELRKIKRFSKISCEVVEPSLIDVKANFDYSVMVALRCDYYLWSLCPYREQFDSPRECKMWNCPAGNQGGYLQCKGLKSTQYKL